MTWHPFVRYRHDMADDAFAAAVVVLEAVLVDVIRELEQQGPLLRGHVGDPAALVV